MLSVDYGVFKVRSYMHIYLKKDKIRLFLVIVEIKNSYHASKFSFKKLTARLGKCKFLSLVGPGLFGFNSPGCLLVVLRMFPKRKS